MKNLFSWQRIWPHLVAVVGFIFLSLMYAFPVLEGKKLNQHDDVQAKAAAHEIVTYHEKTGEWSNWTNSMFGGMPAYMIAGDYPTSISTKMGQVINKILPAPANYLLIGCVSAYILFLVVGAGTWLSALGAIAFGFAAWNLVSLEAGHVSKILAINYAPGVIAGVILAFRRNWLAGAAVTAIFLSLELYSNHVQITYYLGVGIVILVILESLPLIREGKIKQLSFVIIGLAFAAAVSVGTHTTRLWNGYDYSKETIRGKPELSVSNGAKTEANQDGLDKEYAFSYSYGLGETLTLLIPNAYGGSTPAALSNTSETYKTLTNRGLDAATAQSVVQSLPLYWGDQPIVSGPVYAGAIIFFLFILGLFIVKGPLKNWAAGAIVLYVIWAWGKNFSALNYLFFDYFPMFNKFRAVTMVLALVQLLMVFVAILALKTLAQKKISWKELQRPFLISLGITGGISLILALMPTLFFSFQAASDQQLAENFSQQANDKAFGQQIVNAIVQDRAGLMRSDAFRTLFFVLATAALIWMWVKDKIKPAILYPVLILLMIIDMFGIDKRYLNNADFISKSASQAALAPSAADEKIMADPDPDYRVLDVSRSTFNSADASYYHKSLGGYHGAKLRRYQELFEHQIAKQNANPGILNMLNTKYILTVDQQGQQAVQPNPDAFGHAWFVKEYKIVPNADGEMAALDSLKPKETAVLDQRFANQLKGLTLQADSTDKISLITYKPNELIYESNAKNEGLAVFSEIYYNVRDEWKVTIDGKPADMLRANYVLRALRIPAGKHTIKFRFEPVSIAVGSKIDLISSLFLIALIVGAVVVEARRKS
ncbi:YfhO family protein [Dyadobacter diqingensis]|uniref:YfhO family protein n=1 Tax=Dyadobacter diqingensis TaxID=2938121 RepID=UPI0020C3A49D|nr:YfhO family protein [Dyadobacter diqingensis]